MTITYSADVANSTPKSLLRLIFRWRGSIWKAVFWELFVWLLLYGLVSCAYRFWLTEDQISIFEKFANLCSGKMALIPLNFMLGFFVTNVIKRWNTLLSNLGMIDNVALYTANYITGNEDLARNIRRNVVRYCCLSQALVFRDISKQVRKRFPTMETLVASGFMMEHELEKFDSIPSQTAKYWVPISWAYAILKRARREGLIESERLIYTISQEIKAFRSQLTVLWSHDWVPLPLIYPQLVSLAVYVYFGVALISRQFIVSSKAPQPIRQEADLFIPFMTCLEFIFYVGWLKVAMALLNPFGEDDDDFECNYLLDRNLQMGFSCVDEAFDDPPAIRPDEFWGHEKIHPLYTVEASQRPVNFREGSAGWGSIDDMEKDVTMVPLASVNDDSQQQSSTRRSTILPGDKGTRVVLRNRTSTVLMEEARLRRNQQSARRSESQAQLITNSRSERPGDNAAVYSNPIGISSVDLEEIGRLREDIISRSLPTRR